MAPGGAGGSDLQASLDLFLAPLVVFSMCIFQLMFSVYFLLFFFAFGCPGGGHGDAFFQLGGGFSAKAGTFDFERQYNVLAVFSASGGFQKQRKSNKQVFENLLSFRAAKITVRYRFSSFLGSLLDSIFESRAETMELEIVLFSKTCFGSSPGEAGTRFGVLLGCLWGDFWRFLWPQSRRKC